MEWRFPGCCCLPTAAPSTGIGVSRRSRCLEPMTDSSMAAAPQAADGEALRSLAWACAAFAGGVLLNLYRVPPWTAATALLLIAWRLTTQRSRARPPGTLARALPALRVVAVLLFLFLPRLSGAFWAIPRGGEALTGLSDTMSPGGIVKLVASYDPAFRVQFAGHAPPAEELYWRGPVLHDFDGHTWRRASGAFHLRQRLQYLGTPYRYRVALEPTRQRWWFALDTPAQSSDANVLLTYDNQLLGAEPLTEPLSFDALSYTRTRALEPLGAFGRQQDTTPPPGNPRSVALAQTLRQRAGSAADFVQATLEYLRSGGFVYTLTPG